MCYLISTLMRTRRFLINRHNCTSLGQNYIHPPSVRSGGPTNTIFNGRHTHRQTHPHTSKDEQSTTGINGKNYSITGVKWVSNKMNNLNNAINWNRNWIALVTNAIRNEIAINIIICHWIQDQKQHCISKIQS